MKLEAKTRLIATGAVPPKIAEAVSQWKAKGFENKAPYAPIDNMGGCLLKRGDFVKELLLELRKAGYHKGEDGWYEKEGETNVRLVFEKSGRATGCTVVCLMPPNY